MSVKEAGLVVDGVRYSQREVRYQRDRLAELEEQIRAWRTAFPMFGYHKTKHCIMRDDFSGEPPEATARGK